MDGGRIDQREFQRLGFAHDAPGRPVCPAILEGLSRDGRINGSGSIRRTGGQSCAHGGDQHDRVRQRQEDAAKSGHGQSFGTIRQP